MLISILAVVVGLVLLVRSTDKVVEGASAVALNPGVWSLVIGITIFGASFIRFYQSNGEDISETTWSVLESGDHGRRPKLPPEPQNDTTTNKS